MAEPFLGEIRQFAFGLKPQGWEQCNGQILQVAQYQALFTVLGNRYGGDGKTTFALPNLQGRVPLPPSNDLVVGNAGGEATHTLTTSEIPAHTHEASGGADGTSATAAGNVWGTLNTNTQYSDSANATMAVTALDTAGGSAPHENMQPWLALNFCIALQGIYPPKQ